MLKHIKVKITLVITLAIILSMGIVTVLSIYSMRQLGLNDSEKILHLLCENGQRNLDSYFIGVERSVDLLSSYVEEDLETTDLEDLDDHVDRVRGIFDNIASQTNGILTYYYRIDPDISRDVKGFWYIDEYGVGFEEHAVTDISSYDTSDMSSLVWFTVPKLYGRAVWLPPYETENLDVYVLSYNVPVYKDGTFIGVIGIEIDYSTMATQVNNIRLYDTGYAFINDDEGNIIYHPYIDVLSLPEDQIPSVPDGLLVEGLSRYTFDGVEKECVCLRLHNGMRLNVCVPLDEINGNWEALLRKTVFSSVFVLIVFVLLALYFSGTLTKPLLELTKAAKQISEGDYGVIIRHQSNDEVGVLARSLDQLVTNLRTSIDRLKEDNMTLEEATIRDSLTGVRNRFALRRDYETFGEKDIHIMMLDIDDFKTVNDTYGHSVGDYLLKKTGDALIDQFGADNSYRYGGDEFLVVYADISETDFKKALAELEQQLNEMYVDDKKLPVHFSAGYVYGKTVLLDDLRLMLRQADELLYEAKSAGKNLFIGKPYNRDYAESIKKKEHDDFRHG